MRKPTLIFIIIILAGIGIWYLDGQKEERYAGPVEKITIATVKLTAASPIFIAYEKGFFRNEGLNVAFQFDSVSKPSLDSVIEGRADLAVVADVPIVGSIMKGEKISVLATFVTSDKLIAFVARKDGIKTAQDLNGKKIGVAIGNNGEFFMDRFLRFNQIKRSDVEVIDMKPEDMLATLIKGNIDAAVTGDVYLDDIIEELEDGVVIFYLDEYQLAGNLVSQRTFAENNPLTIRKVLKAMIMAEDFMSKNPSESKAITANYLETDVAKVEKLWPKYNFHIALEQSFIALLEDVARWMIKTNITGSTEVPNFLNFIYFDALEAVKPEAIMIIR